MAYTVTNWSDGTTPVDASNLNKIEQGIADATNAITTDAFSLTQDSYISINDETDLNNVKTPGNYACSSSSIANSMENNPSLGVAFILKVFATISNNSNIIQLAMAYNASGMKWRQYYNSAWGDWKTIC